MSFFSILYGGRKSEKVFDGYERDSNRSECDSTHYHHCNVDCDHSEHYHDCAEGCAERGRKIHTEVFFRGDTLKEVVPDSITADQLLHYMVLEDCENQKRRESSAVMQLIMNR